MRRTGGGSYVRACASTRIDLLGGLELRQGGKITLDPLGLHVRPFIPIQSQPLQIVNPIAASSGSDLFKTRYFRLGGGDETSTDCALRRAACRDAVRYALQRAAVFSSRHADQHLGQRPLMQRILDGERRPAWQRDLLAVDGPCSRPLHAHSPPAHHQLARRVSCSTSAPLDLVHISRPARIGALAFEHRGQRGHPCGDDELTQLLPHHLAQQAQHRYFLLGALPGNLLHRRLLVSEASRILSR